VQQGPELDKPHGPTIGLGWTLALLALAGALGVVLVVISLRDRHDAPQPPLGITQAEPPADRPEKPRLRWAPPPLNDPVTLHLGNGFTVAELDEGSDYVIDLPKERTFGGVVVKGGHNVVIKGGRIVIPTDGVEDAERTGVYVKDATGTVHLEGIRVVAKGPGDGVVVNAPKAVVQIENVRVEGIKGSFEGFHADVVQPWGGARELRIDRLTGTSDYQGLQIPADLQPIGSATVRHANMRFAGRDAAGGFLIWLTTGADSCRSYPVTLSDVYVRPRPGRSFAQSVWPSPESGLACGAQIRGGTARWPALPVRGEVRQGLPPGGDFVPRAAAGADYVSPGYCPAEGGEGSCAP
jgi:hypothetical protein